MSTLPKEAQVRTLAGEMFRGCDPPTARSAAQDVRGGRQDEIVRLDEAATEIARIPGQAIDIALSSAVLDACTSRLQSRSRRASQFVTKS